MIRWIEDPPAVDEPIVMPNLWVKRQDAINIAGYPAQSVTIIVTDRPEVNTCSFS